MPKRTTRKGLKRKHTKLRQKNEKQDNLVLILNLQDMKQLFFLVPILFILTAGCNEGTKHKQAASKTAADTIADAKADSSVSLRTPESVEDIQKAYGETMEQLQQAKLDSSSFEYECQQERNGRVTYFSREGQLLLIRHSYGEYSHYEADEEYYIQGDQLYFIFKRETTWAFDSEAGEGATRDNITEFRIYTRQNQAFQCLQKEYVIRSDASNNPKVDQLPNKPTDCKASTSLLNTYLALRKQQSNPGKGCIEALE